MQVVTFMAEESIKMQTTLISRFEVRSYQPARKQQYEKYSL